MPLSPAAPEGLLRPGKVRRARAVLAREGLRGLVMGMLAETVYRRLVLLERELGDTGSPNPTGLEVSFLDPDGLDEYETLRPGEGAIAARRLAEGARCSAVRLEGRLVAVRWLATGEAPVDYLGLSLPLGDGEVYVHDSFTDPALRRRGIARASRGLVYGQLTTEGYTRLVCAVLPENRPSWIHTLASGYEPVGKVGYVRLGPWRRRFLRRRPAQAARHSPRSTA